MGDPPLQTAEAVLARLGLAADTALPALRALGLWSADGPRPGAWGVVEALGESPNPDHALKALTRLAEHRTEAWAQLRANEGLVARTAIVAGASPALADLLVISQPALDVLTGELEPWSVAAARRACAQELAAQASNAQPGGGLTSAAQVLAGLQRRGLLRIAARDLLGMADTPTIAAELADLAQGVLSAAFETVLGEDHARTRVAVIAMGKLGGRELNYVSDVDVIFVHDGDLAQATKAVERFIRLMDAVTPDGRAYQLDANLRPEGRDGPLVRNLKSYASYYERWARTWEFQALIKARPIAGDAALGRDFVALVQPYLWPDRLDPSAVEDVQRMKLRVEDSREVQRAGNRQVKLAPGGLRDIEFAVQLLQLVHGRHDPALRSPNTLEALAALSEGGYVGEDDAGLFHDAYVFLRTVEHRLQLARLRRTHTLPGNATDRARLARSMGFRDTPERDALGAFDAQLTRVQTHVRRLHEKLFYRPLLSRFAQFGAAEQVALGDGEGGLADDASRDRLA
ncbi:MAG: bifunctional glutamine-synthetase adenylyltransferase/deadenyltransferase, partial [Actinomycetota bacterium]|nr:bifunctional glutamine-synthetase adenylyltransferase/deadenyltransferase [Actinomycetota bacterium]